MNIGLRSGSRGAKVGIDTGSVQAFTIPVSSLGAVGSDIWRIVPLYLSMIWASSLMSIQGEWDERWKACTML